MIDRHPPHPALSFVGTTLQLHAPGGGLLLGCLLLARLWRTSTIRGGEASPQRTACQRDSSGGKRGGLPTW